MKIYIKTILIMGIISILSLIISFALLDKPCSYMNWLENVFIGIFSSSLLCLITSCTGYISEEKKSVYSFYWNLSKLKSRALVLSTISDQSKNINSYYNAVYNMNELFRNEFALFDQNFIFIRRKKIQKVLQIYNALFEYKNSSTVAEQKMREFLACTKKQDGTPNYSAEEFQNDISDFYNKTNNFNNTNEPFVIYIEKQMNELSKYITLYE